MTAPSLNGPEATVNLNPLGWPEHTYRHECLKGAANSIKESIISSGEKCAISTEQTFKNIGCDKLGECSKVSIAIGACVSVSTTDSTCVSVDKCLTDFERNPPRSPPPQYKITHYERVPDSSFYTGYKMVPQYGYQNY